MGQGKTLSPGPDRHPSHARVSALRQAEPVRKAEVKKEDSSPRKRSRSPRSKSPLKRQVKFAPKSQEIPPKEVAQVGLGGMRMAEARAAVPRKSGETRSAWKSRIFDYKRQEEEKKGR